MGQTVKVGTHQDRMEWLMDDVAKGVSASGGQSIAALTAQNLSAVLAQTQSLINGLTDQTQTLVSGLTAQTAALSTLLESQESLLQDLDTGIDKLNTTYSETLVQVIPVVGQRTIPQALISNAYQTFELISTDAFYTCDGTNGERILTLERYVDNADDPGGIYSGFPPAYLTPGSRVIGSSWQNANIPAGTSRNMTWCKDAGGDSYTRVPMPQFPIKVSSKVRWRLRVLDTLGASDTCVAVYQFRVFKA